MVETIAFAVFLLILILWRPYVMEAARVGAPFVPQETDVAGRVMMHAKIKPGEIFYELGSGDGRIVIAAALSGARAYGVEIDKFRVLYSRFWIWLLRLGSEAKIIHENIFSVDLSDADIVYLYLLQATNEALQPKLERELKKGTRVISVAFTFPGWKPAKIDPHGSIYGPIYVYQR